MATTFTQDICTSKQKNGCIFTFSFIVYISALERACTCFGDVYLMLNEANPHKCTYCNMHSSGFLLLLLFRHHHLSALIFQYTVSKQRTKGSCMVGIITNLEQTVEVVPKKSLKLRETEKSN